MLPSMRATTYSVLFALLAGCGSEPAGASGPVDPAVFASAQQGDFPGSLSELQLVQPDGFRAPAETYRPAFPLWSNGSDKLRAVVLPGGADGPTPQAARQVGTLFFKTFLFEGKPVETRVLRITDGDPDYAIYLWDDSGSDAALQDGRRPIDVDVSMDGTSFTHQVPSLRQCAGCHEAAEQPALGYTERQLDGELGVELSEQDRGVVEYAVGNCVHCHNGRGLQGTSFSLEPDVFLANTINQQTSTSAVAVGLRVVPGDPEASVLYRGMARGSEDTEDMPSLGVQLRDDGALDMYRAWIEQLAED